MLVSSVRKLPLINIWGITTKNIHNICLYGVSQRYNKVHYEIIENNYKNMYFVYKINLYVILLFLFFFLFLALGRWGFKDVTRFRLYILFRQSCLFQVLNVDFHRIQIVKNGQYTRIKTFYYFMCQIKHFYVLKHINT